MDGARNHQPKEASEMTADEVLEIPQIGGFDGFDWMRAANLGEHHKIRLHCKCPFCKRLWAFDVTERPGVIPKIPDPVRLGFSLLCGTCKAFRRLIYVCRDGSNRVLWWSPYFGDRESRIAWFNLRNGTWGVNQEITVFVNSQDRGPWIEAERSRPTGRDPRLIDEADDEMRAILGPVRGNGGAELEPKQAQAIGWSPKDVTPRVPEVPPEFRGKLTPGYGAKVTTGGRTDD